MLRALDVSFFFLFCRYIAVGYKTLVEGKKPSLLAVVEDCLRGYFARIQIAIIREFLCFE